jgi:hypothetical protein
MIAIEGMSMPSCCMNCGLLGKEAMYCSIYPRKDLDVITVATTRPDWCPLVEIEERKVGKWINLSKAFDSSENPCRCSVCGHILSFMNGYPKSAYCPNCGCRMTKED